MDAYWVRGRYDLWRGVWQIVESNVPRLVVEAPTREQFVDEIARVCNEHAAGRDHKVSVTTAAKNLWMLKSPYGKRVFVNGKLQTREQAAELEARHQAAG